MYIFLDIAYIFFNFQKLQFEPDMSTAECPTDARKRYLATYGEEIQLNIDFRAFVSNYCSAYQGLTAEQASIGPCLGKEGSVDRKIRNVAFHFFSYIAMIIVIMPISLQGTVTL